MPLLNVDQAAERLGTSPRFVRRLIAEHRIAYAKLGKHVRIDSADLDAFVAAGRVEPGVDARLAAAGRTLPQTRHLRSAGGQP
jgi:excisionase family DNA binding protein